MNYKQLTENERYQIYTLMKVGFSLKAIAAELNRLLCDEPVKRQASCQPWRKITT